MLFRHRRPCLIPARLVRAAVPGVFALWAVGLPLTHVIDADARSGAEQVFTAPRAKIDNVRFEQVGGGVLHVFYDLIPSVETARALFEVTLEVSQDAGQTFDLRPRAVSGDVGPGITPGSGKRIVWEAGKDVERLQIDRFRFRVVTLSGNAIPEAETKTRAPLPTGRAAEPATPPPAAGGGSRGRSAGAAEVKLEMFHAGGGISAGWHLGTLTLSPGRVVWTETGPGSNPRDNFSVTCDEIQLAGKVSVTAQQRLSTKVRNYNFYNAVDGKRGKELATGATGVAEFEDAIQKACPGVWK